MPDRLSTFYPNFTGSRRPAPIERVNQCMLSDGNQVVELYPMLGSTHIGPMLLAYLPKQKILNADMYARPRRERRFRHRRCREFRRSRATSIG